MSWLQLKIQTTAKYADNINTFLNLFDAVAITMLDAADQPLLEPDLNTTPLWDEVNILSLFQPNIAVEKMLTFLITQLGETAIVQHQIEYLPEENWERAWLKDFQPMQFGKNLWICPSVMTPPHPEAVNIILDPGLAFGTGTHPTTALCLAWLDANPPQQQTVIDYGCGSGILAIAALKLAATEVWAIDHDEQALTATTENAKRNDISTDKLHTLLPDDFKKIQVDLLIANILTNPLIELASYFAELVKPNGRLVLSGILETQIELITAAYQKYFVINNIASSNDWIRFELCKAA